jgi:hypothetical protein
MSETDHLTEPNAELAEQVRRTPPGMAHWAGTGPAGQTCAGCGHYGYWYETRTGKSGRRASACELYFRRCHTHGNTLPAATPACKYFNPRLTK